MSRLGEDRAREDRRMLLAMLAGVAGGALLARRAMVWLALGAALGWALGQGQRRRRGGRDAGREGQGRQEETD